MLTEKQLHDRRKGIGGSDIGIIMGCQEDTTAAFKGKSIVDVYLSKVDPLYENKINDSMAFGNHIEEFIVRMFETKTGWSVVRENATRKSTTHPILIGNIDGFIPTVNAVLEVKNVDHLRLGCGVKMDLMRFQSTTSISALTTPMSTMFKRFT